MGDISQSVRIPSSSSRCDNWTTTEPSRAPNWVPGRGDEFEVESPWTGACIGRGNASTSEDVHDVLTGASAAAESWAVTPIKERCGIMFELRERMLDHLDELTHIASAESGKIPGEAKAEILKAIEVVEFASSVQNFDTGGRLEVSRGVHCEYRREPLGVVACVSPFNFPVMVPMWMLPIAIVAGNAVVWKPSDKTPLASLALADLFHVSGLPSGVLSVVQGGRTSVEALIDAEAIRAVGFVGSTPVARAVYARAAQRGKRALALGGAKNHIIAMPDADLELASDAIVRAFTGCAGQRCMAASVLLAVGDSDALVDAVIARASTIRLGQDMGAIIDRGARDRLLRALVDAQEAGARLRLDGRDPRVDERYAAGHWLGPCILDGVDPASEAGRDELFGPVLSIVRCDSLGEALALEAANPHGNAACVFTRSGAVADRVARQARSGMIGVNVGVPVPREPFSFGGIGASRFGVGDITGSAGLDFWTERKKITSKWELQSDQTWMS